MANLGVGEPDCSHTLVDINSSKKCCLVCKATRHRSLYHLRKRLNCWKLLSELSYRLSKMNYLGRV